MGTLNHVYQTVSKALGIAGRHQQKQVFESAGVQVSGSEIDGFFRPRQDRRHRRVTQQRLVEYLGALIDDKQQHQKSRRQALVTLRAAVHAYGEQLPGTYLEYWEQLIEAKNREEKTGT